MPAVSVKDRLKGVKIPARKTPAGPVWKGPAGEGPNGGVTQSMLGRYLSCKERFRIGTVEGLKPVEGFNPRMEFGNMWHVCEENFAVGTGRVWANKLGEYVADLAKKYPLQQDQVQHWRDMTLEMFPRYVEYWKDHPDVRNRKVLVHEEKFDVRLDLPSGRFVRLRGKWDQVDVPKVGRGDLCLQDHKTKSTIDPAKLMRQLTFDLQMMTYAVSLTHGPEEYHDLRRGRYNLIRRPAHKTIDSAMKKMDEDFRNNRRDEWFCRLEFPITPADVARFRRETLDPLLENLLDDYEWWVYCREKDISPFVYWDRPALFPHHQPRHFRYPFGVYNPLEESGGTDLDSYMETGSEVGLRRVTDLFPELK